MATYSDETGMSGIAVIDDCIDEFCSSLHETLSYLQSDEEQRCKWKSILEKMYNHIVNIAGHDSKIKQQILLPTLLVKNFDDEQIWQQVELINTVLLENVGLEINKKLTKATEEQNTQINEESEPKPDENKEEWDFPESKSDTPEEHEEEEEEELQDGDVNNDDADEKDLFDVDEMDKFCEELEKETSDKSDDENIPSIFQADEIDDDDDVHESKLDKEIKKIKAKIATHEDEVLKPAPWHMLGESSQKSRKPNALLEEDLQFDHGVRPAPEITLETTNKLEKLIIERIKAKLFDDVERKEKPVGRDKMKQHDLPLNQEKSQISLAEVYEKDYLEAQEKESGAKKEEIDENEESIKNDLNHLFRKLDALSNFVYNPKGIRDEIKIVVNAPAISIEEAMPTAVADTQILAPPEVKAKQKEELRSTLEETQSDKKRKRRKIKKSKSIKSQEREVKKLKLERKSGAKKIKSKSDAVSLVEGEVKHGVSLAKKSSEKINSNFFSKLQDSIDQSASGAHVKKKTKKGASLKKFNKF